MEGPSEDQESQKKSSPFDNLGKDDLIKKCKNLLVIAQKAKQAKDDALDEIKNLKELQNQHEIQKSADKESLKAMQEIVERLTTDKLTLANDIEGYKRRAIKAEKQANDSKNNKTIEFLETEGAIKDDELKSCHKRIAELEKQLIEYQVKKEESDVEKFEVEERLVSFEDQLQEKTKTVENLELSFQQLQAELNKFKESSLSDDDSEKFKSEIFVLNERIIFLDNENSSNLEVIERLNTEKDELDHEFTKLRSQLMDSSELESIRAELEKYKQVNKTLQGQLEDCFQTRSAKTKECENLEKITKEFESVKEDKERDNEHLRKENDRKNVQITNLNEELNICRKELDIKQNELQRLVNELEESIRRQSLAKAEESVQINELNRELESLRLEKEEEIDSLRINLQTVKEDLERKILKMDTMKKAIDVLNTKNQEITLRTMQEVDAFKRELMDYKRNEQIVLDQKNQEIHNLLDKVNEQGLIIADINDLHDTILNAKEQVGKHHSEIKLMRTLIEQFSVKDQENELQTNKVENDELNNLKSLNESYLAEKQVIEQKFLADIQKLQSELDRYIGEVDTLKETVDILSNENDQLHDQNKVINQKLLEEISKAKSDSQSIIESLREKINELESKTKDQNDVHQTEINKKSLEIEDYVAKVSLSKKENLELLDELKEINEALKERGEIISMQMSKISELEIEKSNLELKVTETKKSTSKIEDYEKQITNLKSLIKDLELKLQENQKLLTKADQNVEKDKASQYEMHSDALSTSTISKADESARMKEIDDSYEEKYNKLKYLAVKLKKKVAEQTAIISKLETNNKQELITANESSNMGSVSTIQKEYENLKVVLESKEKIIKQNSDTIDQLQTELSKAKAMAKKTNVLSLEMDSYEKSLSEVSKKLDEKKSQVQEFEAMVESQKITIDSLNKQIIALEENVSSEKSHALKLKQQIDLQQMKLRENEEEKHGLKNQLEKLQFDFEQMKLDFEECKVTLAKIMSEKDTLINSLEVEKAKYVKHAALMQEKMDEISLLLKEREIELGDLKTEHASYKIKAQRALKQNQNKDTHREKELEEELSNLQVSFKSLENDSNILTSERDDLLNKIALIEVEKTRLQSRHEELYKLVEEARVQNEYLIEKYEKKLSDNQETLKAQKLQSDTLRLCYEKQIQELLEKHQKELDSAKNKNSNNAELQASFTDNHACGPTCYGVPLKQSENHVCQQGCSSGPATDEQKISLILMQREEGEGSEHTPSYPLYKKNGSSRSKHDLIPLDELLNSSFDDHCIVEERPISPTIELNQTKEKLVVQETRVKHLSSLLTEAEQDLARLTQLNEVLKEEVRRQQRSIEREQHVHNSEYLKNVVFKFLTLNSGNERIRLVPVLNTILKLSPDETQQLQSVAKGNEGLARFTGILPIWSNNN